MGSFHHDPWISPQDTHERSPTLEEDTTVTDPLHIQLTVIRKGHLGCRKYHAICKLTCNLSQRRHSCRSILVIDIS